MFTGIVLTIGSLQAISRNNNQLTLEIKPQLPLTDLQLGESVALNGCCLTINKFSRTQFQVFVSAATFSCTNLKFLKVNSRVNIERALQFNARVGGHIVTGHIDAVAKIRAISPVGDSKVVTFAVSHKNSQLLAVKGSIAVDGISLTIIECNEQQCKVNLIPETLKNTIANRWQVGYLANIEIDTLAKTTLNKTGSISRDFLYMHGYL